MKAIIFALGVLGGLAAAGDARAADPVLGVWQTQPGDDGAFGQITIAPCGDRLCGTLTKAFDAAGQPKASANVGRQIVWDMLPEGGGAYAGGKIWAPDRDKTYKSKMALAGNRLTVSGCVIGICRSQVWTRVQ